jgi:hypothetical protein
MEWRTIVSYSTDVYIFDAKDEQQPPKEVLSRLEPHIDYFCLKIALFSAPQLRMLVREQH